METITELRPDQELFLLLIVEQGLSATEAYGKSFLRAKPASWAPCASRLLTNAKVQKRKLELERAKALVVRGQTRVTAGLITKELQAIAAQAIGCKQHAAAVAAFMGIAKLHGLLVEKHQVDAIVRRPSLNLSGPDTMSEDAWLQEFGPMIIEHNNPEDTHTESADEDTPSASTTVMDDT